MGIRLSDKHLVYRLANVFEMACSPAFNVLMFAMSLPVAVSFLLFHSAATNSHYAIAGLFCVSVDYGALFTVV